MQFNAGSTLRIAIGIATAGRPEVLRDTLVHLGRQTRQADELLVCPASPADVDLEHIQRHGVPARIVSASRGACVQRNALISASSADVMIFFDDDFLPAPDFLEQVERLFARDIRIVAATGTVLADGILGRGIDFPDGLKLVEEAQAEGQDRVDDVYNVYGCNMVIRLAPVRANALRFDERLPNYAWQEDVDFSRQLAPFGRIVKSSMLRGVHLGTKRSGRSPGRQLGYSQVANPIYLWRKGTLSWRHSLNQMVRNIAANAAKSYKPEPWVDRRGRLRGNLTGLRDALTGRLTPERAISAFQDGGNVKR